MTMNISVTRSTQNQITDAVPSALLEKEKWKLFEDELMYVRQCPFLVCKLPFIWEEEEEEEEKGGGEGGGGEEEEKKKKITE
jgi:hypothetical protein